MKKQNAKWLMFAMLTLVLALAACSAPSKPTITLNPVSGQITAGQDISFQSISADAKGVARVEFSVDNTLVAESNIDPPQKMMTLQHPWKAVAGQHTLSARAFNVDGLASERAEMVVVVATAPAPTTAPTAAPTQPAPTATTAPAAPTPTQAPVPCINAAVFVTDVNYPDGTTVTPNQTFNKTWRVRNTGTCAWTTAYQLVRVAGEKMSAADTYAIPATAPNATADVTVPMTAPATAGMHESRWQLRDPSGVLIGPLVVTVKVNTVVPAPPQVAILSPANGFQFTAGTAVTVMFQGSSNYTEMSSVALYINNTQVAKQTARTPSRLLTGSYQWQPGAGNYDLYAIGVDFNGQQTTSAHIVGGIIQPQPQCQLTVNFRADRFTLNAGEHTWLRWDVECAEKVFLNGEGVVGHNAREIAPNATTNYTLRSIKKDGSPDDRTITITVNPAPPPPTQAPQRRNATGTWRAGDYTLELNEALGCLVADCSVTGRYIEAHGVAAPTIENVSGSINVYSGAMSLVIERPGAQGISCTVAANSASMSCSGSFGSLTFTK